MSIEPQLTRLEHAGLIQLATVDPGLAYLFRHGLIQDATYSTLLRGQRRAWHLAAAEVLEKTCLTEADVLATAPVLAKHFSMAEDHPRALHYLVLAADAAFAHYANQEAAEFYREALAIFEADGKLYQPAQALHLYSRYGRALELTSRFEAALSSYQEMEAAARRHGDLALELAAVMARATIHSTANFAQDLPQAARLLEQARRLAHDLGDAAAEANINWTLMLSNVMGGGDPEETARHGQRALETARASGQGNLLALVLTDLWFVQANASDWDLARAGLLEARATALGLGNLTAAAESILRLSMTDMITGHYDRSLVEMQAATETAEALNSDDMRALMRLCAGVIYADRGEYDRAIAYAEEAVRLGAGTNNVTVLIGTRSDLGRAYAYLGDIERGLALARQAEDTGGRFPLIGGWAGAAVAHLALLRGDLALAAAQVEKYGDYRYWMRRVAFVPMMWTGLAFATIELALRAGDGARALAEAEELDGHIVRTEAVFARPEAQLLLARALLALGRSDEAAAVLQAARAGAEALQARRVLWQILAAQAELAAAHGQAAAAAQLRAQAQAIVRYIADHAPSPALRESFLARPDVKPLMAAS